MNDFVKAIGNKDTKGYKAYFDIGNNQVGITAEYSKKVLEMIIQEYTEKGHKLLRIKKT